MQAVSALCEVCQEGFVSTSLLPVVFSAAADVVPNVRVSVARGLLAVGRGAGEDNRARVQVQ